MPQPSTRPSPKSSFTQTHRCSHPTSSQEDPMGLPYRRAPTLTKSTSTHRYHPTEPATSTAIGRNKINSNCAQPIYGQIASPSPPSNPDNDITLAASFGGSDGNSDYVRSAKNSPTRLASKPDLEGHINELETMQEVA